MASPGHVPTVWMIEPDGTGGVGRYSALLSAAVADAEAGWRVCLVTGRRPEPVGPHGGLEVHLAFWWPKKPSTRIGAVLRRALVALAATATCVRTVLRIRPRRGDVLHMQGLFYPPIFAIAGVLAKLRGIRVIWTPHNTFARPTGLSAGRPSRMAMSLLARWSDAVIVHTNHDLARMASDAPLRLKSVMIPSGPFPVGQGDRAEARDLLDERRDATLFIAPGRMRRDKRLDLIVTAFLDAVPEADGAIRLLIAGPDDDSLTSGLRRIASGSRHGDRVRVVPEHLSQQHWTALFHAADAVVLAYETVSESAIVRSAHAASVPVLAPRRDEFQSILTSAEWGLAFDPDHPSHLTRALLRFASLNDEARLQLRLAIRNDETERPDWSDIARRTVTVYQQIGSYSRTPQRSSS